MDRKRILCLDICTGSFHEILGGILDLARRGTSAYVCAANAHMAVEACRDSAFARVVNAADLVLPDGMPLVKALALLYGVRQERVAGMDLLPRLLAEAEGCGLSVFFFGGTAEVAEAVATRGRREHPGLCIAGFFSPPFRPLAPEEEEEIVRRINASGAHIVLVALGCPRQEIWMARHKGRIQAVMIGVGAAFPVYAGVLGRAPLWMQNGSLEWLYRLGQEPRRLFRRYLRTNSLFICFLVRQVIRQQKSTSPPSSPI